MSQPATQAPSAKPPQPTKGSPVRLIVLLSILGVVLAGFLVDMFYMYDAVKAAEQRLKHADDENANRPFEKDRGYNLTREDVAKAIGFAPTTASVDSTGHLVERYRWWGIIPLQRRYIEVTYEDADGKRYIGKYEVSNRDLFGADPEESQKAAEPPPDPPADSPDGKSGFKGMPMQIPKGPPGDNDAPAGTTPDDKPSSDTPDKPSTDAPDKPSTDAADKPSSDTPDKPSTDAADKPSSDTPDKPSTDAADKPSSDTPDKPSSDDGDKPSSDKPSPDASDKPENP